MKKDGKSLTEDIAMAISVLAVVLLVILGTFVIFGFVGFSFEIGQRLAMVLYGAA